MSTLPEVTRSPRQGATGSTGAKSGRPYTTDSPAGSPKAWKVSAVTGVPRPGPSPTLGGSSSSVSQLGLPTGRSSSPLGGANGGHAFHTTSFKFALKHHQQEREARIEYIERAKQREERDRVQRRAEERETMSASAEKSSKITRRLDESYMGAMSDFSARRGPEKKPEAHSWDAMAKLREEARLNKATEHAEQDHRSAPLRKAMDRVLLGGMEPAIPIPCVVVRKTQCAAYSRSCACACVRVRVCVRECVCVCACVV